MGPIKRNNFVQVLNDRVPLKDLAVLELGCGDGVFTQQLAKVAKYVHASDARSEQVNKAVNRCNGITNILFSQLDVEEKPLPALSFDVVFHVGLLYHLSSPLIHLDNACGAARKAIFLDTHYTSNPVSTRREEHPEWPREGVCKVSVWYPLAAICGMLQTHFGDISLLYDRLERNGPRATILATTRK